MYKRRINRIIIFSLIAAALLTAMGALFNMQIAHRRDYRAVLDGRITNSLSCPGNEYELRFFKLEGFGDGVRFRWRYSFVKETDGLRMYFYGVTVMPYTQERIRQLRIRYAVDGDDRPVLVQRNGEPVTLNIFTGYEIIDGERVGGHYRRHYMVLGREDEYFNFYGLPNFGAPIILLILAALLLIAAGYNLTRALIDLNVEKKGIFAYALIVGSSPSRLGSRWWHKVKYKFQKEEGGEFFEAETHFAFRPRQVEYFKGLEAVGIKYLGKRSVIIEKTFR